MERRVRSAKDSVCRGFDCLTGDGDALSMEARILSAIAVVGETGSGDGDLWGSSLTVGRICRWEDWLPCLLTPFPEDWVDCEEGRDSETDDRAWRDLEESRACIVDRVWESFLVIVVGFSVGRCCA